MRLLQLVMALLLSLNCASAQLSLPELRQLYLAAVESPEKSNQFMDYMNSIAHQDVLMHGYFASAQALVSKHISGPTDKLKYLRLADKSFEEAIEKNPQDAEVRFLRFSVQLNVPRFLGFSDDMDDDIRAMIQNIQTTESLKNYPDWLDVVIKFMIDSGSCSDEELVKFKSILN